MGDIIYRELSYKVQGVVYEVQKELGGNYQEKYYQRAIEQLFKRHSIGFRRELPVDILINGEKIGRHFLDFLIEDRIILETKQGRKPTLADVKQVLMYLKSTGKKLGIIASFHAGGVTIKRVVNPEVKVVE